MPDIRLIKIPKEGDENQDTSRDAWATPKNKFASMCEHWGVKPFIDVSAEPHNTKCALFITPQMNSLAVDWIEFAKANGVPPVFWMNPPYSHPLCGKFVKTASRVSDRGGTVLALLPNFTDSQWFQKYIKPLPKMRRGDYDFPPGRVDFIPPPGIKPGSPRQGNLEVLWLPPGEEG